MDDYEKLIAQSKKQAEQAVDQKMLQKVVKRTIKSSKWRLIFATLTVALLIAPVSYICTLLYYAYGTSSSTLMDVVGQTLYITEPNTSVEEMQFDLSFTPFSMQLEFEQYKRIGKEDYLANKYDLHFTLGNLSEKEITTSLERIKPKYLTQTNPWLTYPYNRNEFNTTREWEVLAGLPDQSVIEAYISLSDVMTVEDIENLMPDVDVLWAAIDTGVEKTNLSKDGDVVSPIGYPVQPDNTTWSPFRDATSNEDEFMKILQFIAQHEELATKVSSSKNLALPERIAFLDEHGIKSYAVVVTGPKQALLALKEFREIYTFKIGEVKLWNWAS